MNWDTLRNPIWSVEECANGIHSYWSWVPGAVGTKLLHHHVTYGSPLELPQMRKPPWLKNIICSQLCCALGMNWSVLLQQWMAHGSERTGCLSWLMLSKLGWNVEPTQWCNVACDGGYCLPFSSLATKRGHGILWSINAWDSWCTSLSKSTVIAALTVG